MKIKCYAEGQWVEGEGIGKDVFHAITGEKIGEVTSKGLDYQAMLAYARKVGGPALKKMTFHERAAMLKNLVKFLSEQKESFYEVSKATGATRMDSMFDIEGGFGTFFSYSGLGKREFPNETFCTDGPVQGLSKEGTFVGRHIYTPLNGTALHINAFNFPTWGMLEKLAPTFLAGMPAIVKPATSTCYLTERVVQSMIESGILPDGALQLICGSVGDAFEHLTSQDIVTFTGSAETGHMLKKHPKIVEESIRFNMEADSLNCAILGTDATPETEEFKLFIKEVVKEMTIKAGQRCTAIRRALVPKNRVDDVITALKGRLSGVVVGDPSLENVRMGALAGKAQVNEVNDRVKELKETTELVHGYWDGFEVEGGNLDQGAFFPPTLLYSNNPLSNKVPHETEAFGPVSTIMPYGSNDEAIELSAMGNGSLVGSLFTADDSIAKEVVLGVAPYHGRLMIINQSCGKESTGHGSPLPQLIHGGPGRAGGGEEMGGERGVFHYMQRTALQGSPTTLSSICNDMEEA